MLKKWRVFSERRNIFLNNDMKEPVRETRSGLGRRIRIETKVVSVVVIVFNHEAYILECLLSILAQETSAHVEIIVCNDASTDDSGAIIAGLVEDNINKKFEILHYTHSQNLGMARNLQFGLSMCTGAYIAFCEGDDFWVDPHKLEKQIHQLNSGFDASLHDCILVNESSRMNRTRFSNGRLSLEGRSSGSIPSETLLSSPIRLWHITSVMLRADICPFEIKWLADFPVVDYPFLATALAGKRIHYDPTPMAAYRKHSASVTAQRTHNFSYTIKMDRVFRETKKHLPARFHTYVSARRAANVVTFLNSLASRNLALRALLTLPLCALSRWSHYSWRDQIWLLKKHASEVFSKENAFK